MKTTFLRPQERSGFALMLVMFTLIAMSLVFGSVALWLASSSKQSAENISFTSSKAVAEGATEMAFAEMDRDFLLSSLGSASSYEQILPNMTNWPVQYTFSDTNGNKNQISVDIGDQSPTLQPLGGQFASLEGYSRIITITATATPTGQIYNRPATVQQQINFATVPAFQFAIFYNINLEIDPGATMPIRGSVFSNGGIWSGNGNPTYYSTVEAAGLVDTTGNDPYLPTYTNNGGTPSGNFLGGQPVSSVDPLEIPIGASGTNNSETNVIAIIQIPPSSVAAPQGTAYAQTNQVYTFNEASLIVSNWVYGTNKTTPTGNNFSVYLQDPWTGPSYCAPSTGHWNQLTNNYYIVTNYSTINTNPTIFATIVTSNLFTLPGFTSNTIPSTINPWSPAANVGLTWTTGSASKTTAITNWGVQYAGWTWLTNVSFFDYRESDTVQAVQVDVGQLRQWITNSPTVNGGTNWNYALAYDRGKGIDSIYVYNSVPLTGTVLPAVRAVNGIRLPNSINVINNTNNITSGLTIATPQPMYVEGFYNVQTDGDVGATYYPGTNNMAHTYPAAFMADAMTILSPSWRDTYNSSTTLSSRSPSTTCVNAACLEGIVASSTNAPMSSAITGYSGGVENFLRLLENWGSSAPLYYNGSIMVMFSSRYATNWWQNTGNYYNAPTRVWSFDSNFTNQLLLPPMTPKFTTVIRTNWTGY